MNKLKICYLEDSAHDAEIAGRTLKNADINFSIELVDPWAWMVKQVGCSCKFESFISGQKKSG